MIASSSGSDRNRDAHGRFTQGNPGGPGNPMAKQVNRLRSALLNAVSQDQLRAIVRALIKEAKGGNVMAAKVLLDRVLGPAEALDFAERIERLEGMLAEVKRQEQAFYGS